MSAVAIIGLGIIGGAMARHLLDAGYSVQGYDPDPKAAETAQALGVGVAPDAAQAVRDCEIILTSLPSEKALAETADALSKAPQNGAVLVEMSTLPIVSKTAAHTLLATAGMAMLDCPVSGTGAQAATKDIVLYASGDEAAIARCQPVFDAVARQSFHVGGFGDGMRMKAVANLLVAIHNVATAEAIHLGARAGLDLHRLYEVIAAGAGSSRIFELRGPMMLQDSYSPATMKLDVWQKDMALIRDFAAALGAETPLFSATEGLYRAALDQGLGEDDTAAVYRLFKGKPPT